MTMIIVKLNEFLSFLKFITPRYIRNKYKEISEKAERIFGYSAGL